MVDNNIFSSDNKKYYLLLRKIKETDNYRNTFNMNELKIVQNYDEVYKHLYTFAMEHDIGKISEKFGKKINKKMSNKKKLDPSYVKYCAKTNKFKISF